MSPNTASSYSTGSLADNVATPAAKPKRVDSAYEQIVKAMDPTQLRWDNMSWVVFGWIAAMHVGALVAPFFFTWSGVAAAVILWWITGSLGVCLCYHRYLAHKGMRISGPIHFFLCLCGTLSAQGSPLKWAATHRLHHARSDQPGDPHSPHDGVWWSHILWMFIHMTPEQNKLLYRKFAPDLQNDRVLLMFEKTFILWSFALAGILYAIGGWSMVLWGMCVRLTFGYHATWLVNSATHLWGYRTYETTDDSRNNWWVALVTWGEGWHNNHHAHPRLAFSGHKWWELDPTWWTIKLLRATGLAWDVADKMPQRRSQGKKVEAEGPLVGDEAITNEEHNAGADATSDFHEEQSDSDSSEADVAKPSRRDERPSREAALV